MGLTPKKTMLNYFNNGIKNSMGIYLYIALEIPEAGFMMEFMRNGFAM